MSDFNFDENTINKLKNMMNKGELNDVISQIPPEMIQNFSSMMQNPSPSQGQSNNSNTNGNTESEQYRYEYYFKNEICYGKNEQQK